MSAPPSRRPAVLHVPEKDLAVAADTCESRVVRCDGDVENRVPVRLVLLDRRCGFDSAALVAAGKGSRQMNGTVGGPGEDVCAGIAGEGHGVDRAWKTSVLVGLDR